MTTTALTITLYSKPNCPLCDHTRHYLERIVAEQANPGAWTIDEVSILDDQDLFAAYRYVIPVVQVGEGPLLLAPESLDEARLRQAIVAGGGALAPPARLPAAATPLPMPANPYGPTAYPYAYPAAPGARPGGLIGLLDRVGTGLGKHWLAGLNTLVGVFAGLPWLAPVFAHLGWWALADPIYTTYMFFCHQLPERAGSLFGYQVAYCYRNSAIYTTIFLLGLLFALARRGGPSGGLGWMLRPLGWLPFLLLLLPMAVDGLTHMFGLREDNAWFDLLTAGRFGDFSVGDTLGTLNWWIRVITGALFGFAVVRLLFPWIQIAFDESARFVWPAPARPQVVEGVRPAPAP